MVIYLYNLYIFVGYTTVYCLTAFTLDHSKSVNPSPAETWICTAFANSVDPDQLASEYAN